MPAPTRRNAEPASSRRFRVGFRVAAVTVPTRAGQDRVTGDECQQQNNARPCRCGYDEGQQHAPVSRLGGLTEEHAGESETEVVLAFVAGGDEGAGVRQHRDPQMVRVGHEHHAGGEVAQRTGVAHDLVSCQLVDEPPWPVAGVQRGVPPLSG